MDQDIELIEIEQENIEIENIDEKFNIYIESPVEDIDIEEPETPDEQMYESLLGTSTVHTDVNHSQYLPNQHTIGAVTGLTETLENIQALKDTIYTNKTNIANYYLWNDENPLQENRKGYFVCINQDNKISICSNQNNVFGVTVSEAGFVGGQDEIAHDYKYELVLNTGIANVCCELDVVAGDYVRPNIYGRAKKNNISGYKVIAVNEVGEDRYATISLSSTFDIICDSEDKIDSLEDRMYNAEANISSATNLANSAYSMAESSLDAIRVANEANNKAISAINSIEDLEDGVNTAITNADQALSIANATSIVAVNIRNEAIEAVNQALEEVQDISDEVEQNLENIEQVVDDALTDARSTLVNDLENATPILNIQGFIDNGYVTLDNWPSDPTPLNTSRVYYVSNENPHYYHYYNGSAWSISSDAAGAGLTESIMHLKQSVNENSSSISSLTSRIGRNCIRVNSFNNAADTYIIDDTTYDADTSKVYYAKNSGLYWYYNGIWASTESPYVAGLSESIALTNQVANADESEIESINTWIGDSSNGAVKSIADVTQKANANESSIESINTWIGDSSNGAVKAIADVTQKANDNEASITNLTTWRGTTNTAIANLQEIVGPEGAKIQSLISNIDKYRIGEYSQANELTFDQALDFLEIGNVYIPTVNHTEVYNNSPTNKTTQFTRGYYYTWSNNGWVESASTMVSFSINYIEGSANTPYWYVNTNTNVINGDDEYYAHALYYWQDGKWQKVASGSSLGRSVGLLQAKSDEISLSVSNANSAIGQLQTRVTNDEAQASMIASMVTNNANIAISGTVSNISSLPSGQSSDTYYAVGSATPYDVYKYDGTDWNKISYLSYDGVNVKEVYVASIINSVNDSGSAININADKINFTGFTTFLRPSDVGSSGSTTVDGARITTGTVNAARLNISDVITAVNNNTTTTISGGKITTNSITANQLATDAITSSNYVANTSGTKLDLSNGVFDSKNFKIAANGNVTASNMTLTGGAIQSSNYSDTSGMKINLQYGTIDSPNFKIDSGGNVTARGIALDYCTVNGESIYGGIPATVINYNTSTVIGSGGGGGGSYGNIDQIYANTGQIGTLKAATITLSRVGSHVIINAEGVKDADTYEYLCHWNAIGSTARFG